MARQLPELVTKKVSDLCVLADPAREVSPEALYHLKKQHETFGLLQVHIVLNKRTGRIIGGRKSLSVLKELNVDEVPVSVVDIEPDLEPAAEFALNNHAGEWIWRPVSEALKVLKEKQLSLQLTGFHEYDTNPLVSAEWTRDLVQQRVEEQKRLEQESGQCALLL